MTARTRKATTPTTKTAARKSPARKTAAKKTTAGRPARQTDKNNRPLSLVKTEPAPQPTTVNLYKLPRPRRRLFVGPMGVNEQAAVRAALAAASARLPIPVRTWNGSTAHLADGLLLIHNPGPDRIFTAHIACCHGAIHGYPIRNHHDLREARALTRTCETPHNPAWDNAITHGVRPLSIPTVKVSHLAEGLATARKDAAETQPLSRDEIAAGLAARADQDTPKEHPQP